MDAARLRALLDAHAELVDGETRYLVPAQWWRSLWASLESPDALGPLGLIPTSLLLAGDDDDEAASAVEPPAAGGAGDEPARGEWTCPRCEQPRAASDVYCAPCVPTTQLRHSPQRRRLALDFCAPTETEQLQLRAGLVQPDDVITVPEPVWRELAAACGVDGPALPRPVVASALNRRRRWVDLYPVTLYVFSSEAPGGGAADNEAVRVSVGRYQTNAQLRASIGPLINVPYHKMELLVRRGERLECVAPLAENKTATMEELGLRSRDVLMALLKDDEPVGGGAGGGYAYSGSYYRQREAWASSASGGAWGASVRGEPPVPGAAGIANVGNTCFLGAAAQALSHTRFLADLFATGAFRPLVNKKNKLGTKGEVSEAFGALLAELWSGNFTSASPRRLRQTVARRAPQFVGYQQQDAHELFTYLTDALHEDLRPAGEPDSPVSRGLFSVVESAVQCSTPGCAVSLRAERYSAVSLPLPQATSRAFPVVFVPWGVCPEAEAELQRFGVVASAGGVIADVRAGLAALVGRPAELLVLAEVQRHRVVRVRGVAERLDTVAHSDYLVAYEMPGDLWGAQDDPPPPPDLARQRSFPPDTHFVSVLMRRDGGRRLFGMPLLVPLADVPQQPAAALRAKALHCFPPAAGAAVRVLEGVEELALLAPEAGADDTVPFNYLRNSLGVDWPPGSVEALAPAHPQLRALRDGVAPHASLAAAREATAVRTSLQECLAAFAAPELLAEPFQCDACGRRVEGAVKTLALAQPAPVLAVHLKRLTQTESFRVKLDCLVQFPLRGLEVAGRVFDLFAVVNHEGGAHGGHYTAAAVNRNDGKWYGYSDAVVSCMGSPSEEEELAEALVTPSAYLLLYAERGAAAALPDDEEEEFRVAESLDADATEAEAEETQEEESKESTEEAVASQEPTTTTTTTTTTEHDDDEAFARALAASEAEAHAQPQAGPGGEYDTRVVPMDIDDSFEGLREIGGVCDDWSCAACTFLNSGANGGIMCEICGSPGPRAQ